MAHSFPQNVSPEGFGLHISIAPRRYTRGMSRARYTVQPQPPCGVSCQSRPRPKRQRGRNRPLSQQNRAKSSTGQGQIPIFRLNIAQIEHCSSHTDANAEDEQQPPGRNELTFLDHIASGDLQMQKIQAEISHVPLTTRGKCENVGEKPG